VIRQTKLIFRLLLAVWVVVIVWQGFEHGRVKEAARNGLIRKARDITRTLGTVLSSQRRWAFVTKERLKPALNDLVESERLKAIVLLNAAGTEVISAGDPVVFGSKGALQDDIRWGKESVTIINLVDLGTNLQQDGTKSSPSIVVDPPPRGFSTFSWGDLKDPSSFAAKLRDPADDVSTFIRDRLSESTRQDLAQWQGPGEVPPALQESLMRDLSGIIRGSSIWDKARFNKVTLRPETRNALERNPRGDDLVRVNRLLLEDAYPLELSRNPPRPRREDWQRFPPPDRPPPDESGAVSASAGGAQTNSSDVHTNRDGSVESNRPRGGRPGFRRPPWMSEQEFNALKEKQGVHGLAMVLPTDTLAKTTSDDLWLRSIICGFAGLSVMGYGLAWRSLVKSSEFQMRLVRASETNSHLQEMSVAAAGLAHETRNPLNIIRGLAQMISKAPEASEPVRKKSLEITDEVDRVTVQLNEFINYSKPREVRRSPVAIGTVVNDVVRALKSDLEDKTIKLDLVEENLTINADQQLLRQVLFNLLINAIQAVQVNGQIKIVIRKTGAREACFEISDNGPGVPEDQRAKIFRPYFTTRVKGTGLGLAVVKQIVMVHGWDVECLPNNGQGALFRVSRLEMASPA
jgi:two-component sensor histidine kinase